MKPALLWQRTIINYFGISENKNVGRVRVHASEITHIIAANSIYAR